MSLYTKEDLAKEEYNKDIKKIRKDIHFIALYCKIRLFIIAFIVVAIIVLRLLIVLIPSITLASLFSLL